MRAEQKKNDIGGVSFKEAGIGAGAERAEKRERSTIDFPYNDLDNAVAIAKGVERAGGTACALDQLAAALSVTVSGPFRTRIANAKTFGFVETGGGQVRLSELGRSVVDPAQEAWARAEAFSRVPLFSAIYERYKGFKLAGAAGLESEIGALGVSSKQTDKARQALMRSARQAGFFAHGEDRLVKPSVQGPGTRPLTDGNQQRDKNGGGGGEDGGQGGKGNSGNGQQELPHFVRGLLKSLPPEGSNWTPQERVKWLEAAARCFDLMYAGGDGKIIVTVTKDDA